MNTESQTNNFMVRGMKVIGMPKSRGKFPGVYIIGNIYVGASCYVLSRLKNHFNAYLRDNKRDEIRDSNPKVFNYLKTCFDLGLTPKIYFADPNPMNEKEIKISLEIPFSKMEKFYHENKRYKTPKN